MKLRIRGNSLRLRLQASELCRLRADSWTGDAITFGAARLEYVLEVWDDVDAPRARYEHSRITVSLLRAFADA